MGWKGAHGALYKTDQKAREDSLTSKIIKNPRCVTLQKIMLKKHQKVTKKPERVTDRKSTSRNKWEGSIGGLSEDECEQKRGNK